MNFRLQNMSRMHTWIFIVAIGFIGTIIVAIVLLKQDPRLIATIPVDQPVINIAATRDASIIAAVGEDGTMWVWQHSDHVINNTYTVASGNAKITVVAFDPSGELLAAGDTRGQVRIWHSATGKLIYNTPTIQPQPWRPEIINGRFEPTWRGVLSIAFSPNGALLGVGGENGQIAVIDVTNGGVLQTMRGHPTTTLAHYYAISRVAFSPDSRVLASGASNGDVWLWNMQRWVSEGTLPGSGDIAGLQFYPDNQRITVVHYTKSVRVWLLSERRLLIDNYNRSGGFVSIANDAKTIAARDTSLSFFAGLPIIGQPDTKIYLNVLPNLEPSIILSGHHGVITALAFTPEGSYLVSGSQDYTVRLWQIAIP